MMKLRLTLVALSFIFSLLIPADRLSDSCADAWKPIPLAKDFPEGLGVNIHFTDPQPGETAMIASAGFRWIRMDFVWEATEKTSGVYDFTAYDRLMAALDKQNLRALFILDYGNSLYDGGAPPRTAESRHAFSRWAIAAAKHFAGRGVVWEIYNEPNTKMFWPPRPNADEYIALALEVGRGFHSEAPNEKLIGPAAAGIDFAFLESCFKAGLLDYWSAVSVHPYRQLDPETTANDYCRLRQLIAQYSSARTARGSERVGADNAIPIISSEWGYSSVWRAMDDEKQSTMLAREMLTNTANGIPISIWYDWRDDGLDAGNAEHHFGLVRHDVQRGGNEPYLPKPAYVAAKTVGVFIDGYEFGKRLGIGSTDDYVLFFRKGNEVRVVAWTTLAAPHTVTIPLDGSWISTTANRGEVRLGSSGPSGLTIQISNVPLYLRRNS